MPRIERIVTQSCQIAYPIWACPIKKDISKRACSLPYEADVLNISKNWPRVSFGASWQFLGASWDLLGRPPGTLVPSAYRLAVAHFAEPF